MTSLVTLEYSHASTKGRSGSGKARKKKRAGGAGGSSSGASGGGGGSGMMAAARNGEDLSDDERNPADDVSVSDSDSSVGSAGSDPDTDGASRPCMPVLTTAPPPPLPHR